MKALFLDIDGVLNGHEPLASGYAGICRERAAHLNAILDSSTDVRIVITSAWRYMILNGNMTLKGFEYLLLVSGVRCLGRIHGHTCADGDVCDEPPHDDVETWSRIGLQMRAGQIQRYIEQHGVTQFVVLDDLPLDVPNLVLTERHVGLTADHVANVVAMLNGSHSP